MISRPVHVGAVGTNLNARYTHVLLQVQDDDGEQSRCVLSATSARKLAEELQRLATQAVCPHASVDAAQGCLHCGLRADQVRRKREMDGIKPVSD